MTRFLLLCACVCCFAPSLAAGLQLQFAPAVHYPAGHHPEGGALLDVDGQNSGGIGGCQGTLMYTLAEILAHPQGSGAIVVGSLVHCQSWFRDPQVASTTGLTNALVFEVLP